MNRRIAFTVACMAAAVLGAKAEEASVAQTVTARVDLIDELKRGEMAFNIVPLTPKEDTSKVFTVNEAGELVVSGRGFGYMTTKKSYKDYRVALEFKWVGTTFGNKTGKAIDNGIFVHAHGPEGCVSGTWVPCVEINVTEGGMGDFWILSGKKNGETYTTCATCEVIPNPKGEPIWTPGAQPTVFSNCYSHVWWLRKDPAYKDVKGSRGCFDLEKPMGQWNVMEVEARGERVRAWFNGVLVNEAVRVQPSEGRVCLETEGAGMIARRFELLPLK